MALLARSLAALPRGLLEGVRQKVGHEAVRVVTTAGCENERQRGLASLAREVARLEAKEERRKTEGERERERDRSEESAAAAAAAAAAVGATKRGDGEEALKLSIALSLMALSVA